MSNQISKETRPQMKTLTLYSDGGERDLTTVYTELNIYASIDVPCNSGDVTIRENEGNIIVDLKLQGREFIEIEFNGQEGEYESYHRVFYIYAIGGLVEEQNHRTFKLFFTDAAGMANADNKISIVYDKKAEDIIESMEKIMNGKNGDIYNTGMGKVGSSVLKFNKSDSYSVTTQNTIKTVVPMWKPFTLIDYYVSHAVSSDQPTSSVSFADCVFFQNRKGDYILSSYKKMFDTPYKTQYKINYGGTSTLEITRANNNQETHKVEKYGIEKFEMSTMYNIQERKLNGVYGSTLSIMDFARSCYINYPLDINKICSSVLNYLGLSASEAKIPLTQSCNPLMLYSVTNINLDGDAKSQESYNNGKDRFEKFTVPGLTGVSIANFIRCNKVEIVMNGASDIDIGIPVAITMDTSNSMDKLSSVAKLCTNTWVVSKYTHKFKPGEYYKTKIECFTPFLKYSS